MTRQLNDSAFACTSVPANVTGLVLPADGAGHIITGIFFSTQNNNLSIVTSDSESGEVGLKIEAMLGASLKRFSFPEMTSDILMQTTCTNGSSLKVQVNCITSPVSPLFRLSD